MAVRRPCLASGLLGFDGVGFPVRLCQGPCSAPHGRVILPPPRGSRPLTFFIEFLVSLYDVLVPLLAPLLMARFRFIAAFPNLTLLP